MQELLQYEERKSFRGDGERNYMILESGSVPALPYQINMLQYNKIDGVLPVKFYIENCQYKYFYDVTGVAPISEYLNYHKFEFDLIKSVFTELFFLISEMEAFLLDSNKLILLPEYIYRDSSSMHLLFCYYPDKDTSFQESLAVLLEYMMNHLPYEDDYAVQVVYGIHEKLIKENAPLGELLKTFCLLEDCNHNAEAQNEEVEREAEADQIEQNDSRKDFLHTDAEKSAGNKTLIAIEAAGALVTLALVLYMVRFHNTLSGQEFIVWLVSLVLILGGSSYLTGKVKKKEAASFVYEPQEYEAENPEIKEKTGSEALNLRVTLAGRRIKTETEVPESDTPSELFEEISFDSSKEDDVEVKKEEDIFSSFEALAEPFDHGNPDPVPKTEIMHLRDEIPATVFMRDSIYPNKPQGVLKAIKPIEMTDITIDRDCLLVGKVPGMADICLSESCVSRVHACFYREASMFFIEDLKSLNGTYVNGVRLIPHERKDLKEGDLIRLANLEYQFVVKNPEKDTQTIGFGV